ncbi:glycosyltransferase family 4 protein [Lysinibacillus sp. NPDC093688]|uniref:glycosyltransferase family 4 protein n=1 Tax=Lysinibacillus sp. NPDC093688 TaxID=3390577 RepID=UPI003CFE4E58
MKILWLTNIAMPEASKLMDQPPIPFGGWLINMSKVLTEQENIELSIAFPKLNSKKIEQLNGKVIKYFAFPIVQKKNKALNYENIYLKSILKEVQPDLVHIFGTEFAHSLAMVNACNDLGIRNVINIQGLTSVIAKHYTANLPLNIQKKFTFRDFIKQKNIIQQKKEFEKRGLIEIEAIQNTNHIIGRTTWDYACTMQINPNVNYHFCNEILREEFYKNKWTFNNCERHTIFMSQAAYPIKGLHYMLEALPLIIMKYPETKLYIAGPDITASNSIKERLKKTSYSKYITMLLKKYQLTNYVFFTGLLDEKKMCERFLKTNVFVSPSSIENESNSLSEAKILGVPCVTSFVGGVIDRIDNKNDGFFYPADAPYMLAYYVCEIFGSEDLANKFSANARKHALQMHDKEKNLNTLLKIYNEISSSHC